MFRLWYRQRRRLLFCLISSTLALFFFLDTSPDFMVPVYGWPAYWFIYGGTALIMGLMMVLGAMLLLLVFPSWRSLIDILAISSFCSILLNRVLELWFDVNPDSSILAILPYAIYFAFIPIFLNSALDRVGLRLKSASTRSFKSDRSASELWDEMVPICFEKGKHWDIQLVEVKSDPEAVDCYTLIYAHKGALSEQSTITVVANEPNRHFRYDFVNGVGPKTKNSIQGTDDIKIVPLDNGRCQVTISIEMARVPSSIALLAWFDDRVGSQVDHIVAKHKQKWDFSTEGRYRRSILGEIGE